MNPTLIGRRRCLRHHHRDRSPVHTKRSDAVKEGNGRERERKGEQKMLQSTKWNLVLSKNTLWTSIKIKIDRKNFLLCLSRVHLCQITSQQRLLRVMCRIICTRTLLIHTFFEKKKNLFYSFPFASSTCHMPYTWSESFRFDPSTRKLFYFIYLFNFSEGEKERARENAALYNLIPLMGFEQYLTNSAVFALLVWFPFIISFTLYNVCVCVCAALRCTVLATKMTTTTWLDDIHATVQHSRSHIRFALPSDAVNQCTKQCLLNYGLM